MTPAASAARPAVRPARWDAIVVAGGRANRLGGIDKTALTWNGRSLLDGAVAALVGAGAVGRVCVVGSDAELDPQLLRTVETPRWGGPAAAIVAGLVALKASRSDRDPAPAWVLVLAGDLVQPAQAVAALAEALDALPASTSIDALVAVDSTGRRQPLLAAYRLSGLTRAAEALVTAENAPVRMLVGGLSTLEVPLPDELSDDVDTPDDAARLGIALPSPPMGAAPGSTAPTGTAPSTTTG